MMVNLNLKEKMQEVDIELMNYVHRSWLLFIITKICTHFKNRGSSNKFHVNKQ